MLYVVDALECCETEMQHLHSSLNVSRAFFRDSHLAIWENLFRSAMKSVDITKAKRREYFKIILLSFTCTRCSLLGNRFKLFGRTEILVLVAHGWKPRGRIQNSNYFF